MPTISSYAWARPNILVRCTGHDGDSFYERNTVYLVFDSNGALGVTPYYTANTSDPETWPTWNGLNGHWEFYTDQLPNQLKEKMMRDEELEPFEEGDIVFLSSRYPGPLKVMAVNRREVLLADDVGSQSWEMKTRVYREPFQHGFDTIAIRKSRPWSWGAVVAEPDDDYNENDEWAIHAVDTPCEDPVLKSLGLTMGVHQWYNEDVEYYIWGQDRNLRRWFIDNVWHAFFEAADRKHFDKHGRHHDNRKDLLEFLPCSYIDFITRVQVFLPTRSNITLGHISIFESVEKMKQNRKTSMKPGRAIRKIFPEIDDATLEKVVDRFREDFPNHNYEVVVSKEKEDFELAYNGRMAAYQNIYTTRKRKSLANSCMRGGGAKDWKHLECHPGATYASGDFTIIYARVKNNEGEYLIGGRCVVATCFNPPRYAPLYGVDEASMDAMQVALDKMGAVDGEDYGWAGAKMLRVPHRGSDEDFVLPYLDVGPCTVDSSNFTICDSGDLDCTDYSGVISTRSNFCCHCGDHVHPDDAMHDPDNGEPWCSDCFHDHYFYCDHYGEYHHIDTENTVFYLRRGYTQSLQVCDTALECGEYIYCEDIDEWWKEEDVVRLHNGEYTSIPYANDNCSTCYITGDMAYTSDMILVKNENGDEVYVIEETLEGNDDYEEVSDKIYLYAHVSLNENQEEEEVA